MFNARAIGSIVLVVVLFWAVVSPASEQLRWETIYPGVTYLAHRFVIADKSVDLYAVSIDLEKSGAKVMVSPQANEFKTTSEMAKEAGAQIAINGGFSSYLFKMFGMRFWGKPFGLTITDGKEWPGIIDNKDYSLLAVNKNGKLCISPVQQLCFASEDINTAISGYPMVVKEGKVGEVIGRWYDLLNHPRTAVGVDRSGKKLFLVVTDGRQRDSASIGLKTLAGLMLQIGVWDGLNFDGGGSSTLYIKNKGGVVNHPSDGQERAVLDSLLVMIK